MRFDQVRSNSLSRRSAGALLMVGVLAGVTVGGGVGVIAASSTKSVTVCVNKKTNVLRYAKSGKCVKTETKVLLNQTVDAAGTPGVTGANGDAGAAGASGAKGDTGVSGATGAKGADGAAGAKGDAGATGAKGADGTNGVAGTKGDAGTNGSNGTNGTASSFFTPLEVCGIWAIELCAFGSQGPGGGTVFFLDTEGKYSDFDYLEVAPTDASTGVVWSTTTPHCGLTQNASCQGDWLTTSGEAFTFMAVGKGRAATAAIVARHEAGGVPKTAYAAGIADLYTTPTATDWFLPSEMEMYLFSQLSYTLFASGTYWSSTEMQNQELYVYWVDGQDMLGLSNLAKFSTGRVRAIRSF